MAVKVFRVLVIIVITALLGVMSYNLITYKDDNENRAIIVIHGIVGGGLVDAEGNPVFDPYGSDHTLDELTGDDAVSLFMDLLFGDYSDITRTLINGILNDDNSILRQITSDEDGNVQDNGIVAANANTSLKYGAMNAYKGIYEGIYNEFNEDIEVVFFQYDWREDNLISAQHLEDFINAGGWDEVIICAHSMGNVVTSCYLGKSEANRAKVRGYMAMAAPFYGATMSLSLLEDPYSFIEGVQDIINNNALLKSLVGDSVYDIYTEQALPLIYNMASVGQLLPTIEYADALKEYYGSAFITVDGNAITTSAELAEFYASRPWAKKANNETRAFIANLNEFWNSSKVTVNGVTYHSSELVNTVYFAGTGVKTQSGISITNGVFTEEFTNMLGDGTVPLYSAILGEDLNNTDRIIHTYSGYDHMDTGMMYEGEFRDDLSLAIRFLL